MILSLAVLLAVTGCKTTSTPIAGKAIDSMAGKHDATEERLSTAASHAMAEGRTEEALANYERIYKQPVAEVFTSPNYRNEDAALNYAQLLRKTGKAQRALEVLSPVVEKRSGRLKDRVDPIVLNEYAAIQIDLGNLEKAEKILNTVLEDQKDKAFHADAYNLLGVSLDARGRHKEAEQYFRQALDGWKGDKTSVMNNLAISLASQGMFDESLRTLRQALVAAPHKKEIAQNIQMVSDLKDSVVAKPKKSR
jgi:Flp pilus assembly protein TadD